jgi:hypothetical protein
MINSYDSKAYLLRVIKTNIDIDDINKKIDIYKDIKHPNITSIKKSFFSDEFENGKI